MRTPEKERRIQEKKEKRRLRRKIFWMIAMGLLVLSPIDVMPDFVPLIGQIDDILYIAGAVAEALLLIRNRNALQKPAQNEMIINME